MNQEERDFHKRMKIPPEIITSISAKGTFDLEKVFDGVSSKEAQEKIEEALKRNQEIIAEGRDAINDMGPIK